MASTVKSGPQDLPPPGGYAPFNYQRSKLRTIIGGRLGIALFYGITSIGCFVYYLDLKSFRRSQIEMTSSQCAIRPLIEAERDRALLRHMRHLRDEEADVMKNVPGWEVGTFYGVPVFNTLRSEFFEPRSIDAYVFTDPADYLHRLHRPAII